MVEFGEDYVEYAKAVEEMINFRCQYPSEGGYTTVFFIPIEPRFLSRETERNFGLFAQTVVVETEVHVKGEARTFRINLERELQKKNIMISNFVLVKAKFSPKDAPIPYFWGTQGLEKYRGVFFSDLDSDLDASRPFTVIEKWHPEKQKSHKMKIIQDGKTQLTGEYFEEYCVGFLIRRI